MRIIGDDADAADVFTAAVADPAVEAVLVHRRGVEFADGAPARLVAALHRPHRRLVRVHADAGCYVADTALLSAALRHGVTAAELVADDAELDRRIAEALGVVPLEGRTPIEDPAAGRWRTWVDGAVVGVRASAPAASDAPADDDWAKGVARRQGAAARLTAVARRRIGAARRELVRRRQRPQSR